MQPVIFMRYRVALRTTIVMLTQRKDLYSGTHDSKNLKQLQIHYCPIPLDVRCEYTAS